ILLWVAGLTHLFFGNVDIVLMANILIGSLPGVSLGTHLITRVPTPGPRITLAVVLLASAFGVLQKAVAGYGLGVTIGVPLAIAVARTLIYRVRSKRFPTPDPPAPTPALATPAPASSASTQPENPT